MGVAIQIWTLFSISHVKSAAWLARSCHKLEITNKSSEYSDRLKIEHVALVTGCVLAAVAFLEATINELYAGAAEGNKLHGHVGQLSVETRKLMGSLWSFENFAKGARTLEKYQSALKLGGRTLFNTGVNPYQDCHSLIMLRNAFVHYEPEWVWAHPVRSHQAQLHKIEKGLKGKFSLNPFFKQGRPFFPQQCLSHGCAEWATRTSMAFVEAFYQRMGLTNSLAEIRHDLSTA